MTPGYDVLVVDDEPVVVSAARKVLLPEGLSVDDAPDTEIAFGKLRDLRYKMILCDLKLPGAGGWELVRFARETVPGTPVVMITGYATLDNTVESFKIGAYDFLPKPFDIDELVGVVRRAIRFAALDDSLKRTVGLDEFQSRRRASARELSRLYSLGGQSWAGLQADGTACIGLGESFAGLPETIRSVDLPAVDGETLQGRRLCWVTSSDDSVCRVVAPLSGRIIETNRDLEFGTPFDARSIDRWWLVRLAPSDLQSELENLTSR